MPSDINWLDMYGSNDYSHEARNHISSQQDRWLERNIVTTSKTALFTSCPA
nr:hyp [Cotesia vestalis bracovirus]